MKGDRLYTTALKSASKEDADLDTVFKLLNKAYKQGNPKAAYALGTWYLFGKHVEKNVNKAFDLFVDASNDYISEACFDLAKCYEEGIGVKQSLNDAFKSYLEAALLGDKQAIYEVGRCYYYGIGTKADKELSKVWLDVAAHYGIEG